MTDPIADFIIRIKNAFMAGARTVRAPRSAIKKSLAEILVAEGYLESVEVVSDGKFDELLCTLKYVDRAPAVTNVRRVSKPGRRVYATVREIPKTLGGYGITIVSTNKGILTDAQARQQNVGGEVLCQVW